MGDNPTALKIVRGNTGKWTDAIYLCGAPQNVSGATVTYVFASPTTSERFTQSTTDGSVTIPNPVPGTPFLPQVLLTMQPATTLALQNPVVGEPNVFNMQQTIVDALGNVTTVEWGTLTLWGTL